MFKPKPIKVKAWDIENKLMKRVGRVDCIKSQLHKDGHILLQYTGMHDQADSEIFDGDILLYEHTKHMVYWNDDRYQWEWSVLNSADSYERLTVARTRQSLRLRHTLETTESED